MKVQRRIGHEIAALICINIHLKGKCKQPVNVVIIIGKNSEVSVALQIELLVIVIIFMHLFQKLC